MSTVKETVDVEVPVHTAYNQWTQFEDFPNFMEGVEEVRQLDDRHNHWTTKIGGVRREFDTEIVDQMPDDRITWRSIGGDSEQRGSVRFQRLDDAHTRVELTMDVEPTGAVEKGGDMLGVIDRRVKGTCAASRTTSSTAAAKAVPGADGSGPEIRTLPSDHETPRSPVPGRPARGHTLSACGPMLSAGRSGRGITSLSGRCGGGRAAGGRRADRRR